MVYKTAMALVLGAATLVSPIVYADEIAVAAREVSKKNSSAIVTLRITINERMSFPDFGTDESKAVHEVSATVIHPDGLIVAALSDTDPSAMFDDFFSDIDLDGFKMEAHVESLMIRIDGEEVEGKVVLQDRDLDLAFIRPTKKPDKPMAAVDLSLSPPAEQFDPVILLFRHGKVARRTGGGAIVRVSGVMKKPRTFYVLDVWGGRAGSPAFNLEGECIGIVILRTIESMSESGFGWMMDEDSTMIEAILPAKDVLEVAEQAPGYEDDE